MKRSTLTTNNWYGPTNNTAASKKIVKYELDDYKTIPVQDTSEKGFQHAMMIL